MSDNATIAAELRELCSRRATGRYSIVSNVGPRATLTLDRGEITSVSYRAFAGRRALEGLTATRLRDARTHFTDGEGGATAKDPTLPSTGEIIEILSGGAAPRSRESAVQTAGLPEAELKLLRKILVECVGPIGNLVLDGCLRRQGSDTVEALLNHLAAEVPPHIREQFLAAAREGLARMGDRRRAP